MVKTGMQSGEITALTWNDIDFENNMIYVNKTLAYYRSIEDHMNRFSIHLPKTEAGKRKIPMLPIVKDALLLEKQYQEELGITCNFELDGFTDFVFMDYRGENFNYNLLNKALGKIVRACNQKIKETSTEEEPHLLPHISCHILRHTCATRLNEANLNIKAVQAILGHTDIQTTMNIYTDATDDLLEKSIDSLQKHLEKLENK